MMAKAMPRLGSRGFAATSVEDLARAARVTTGALYHHFSTKTALFEIVFEQVHGGLLAKAGDAAGGASHEVEALSRGFEAFLDGLLLPEVQRILIIDAPAVLGLARYTELDERYAYATISEHLREAVVAGRLHVQDTDTIARLLLGAVTRAGMLIANAADPRRARDDAASALRRLLLGLAHPPA